MEKYDDLFLAVEHSSLPEVRRLLDAGADVNERDISDSTPIFKVEEGDIAKALIDAGADIHATDEDGFTPLHNARRSVSVVRVLIEAGADVKARNKDGFTPLFFADEGSAKAMIEARADVNEKDDLGFTPLFFADESSAKVLIEAGADIHVRGSLGQTASEWHLSCGRVKLADFIETHAIKVEQAKLQTTIPVAQPKPIKKKAKAYI